MMTYDTFLPTSKEIEKLIAKARNHPLGIQFLLNGDLCAVATIFGVHVFTVEAARNQWNQKNLLGQPEGGSCDN